MKNTIKFGMFFLATFITISCDTKDPQKIIVLLKSKKTNDLIYGADMAGRLRDKVFVPLLLKNANNPSVSVRYNYQGVSVYQAKMVALGRIFNSFPTVKITSNPDSAVIKFYLKIAKSNNIPF